MAALVFDWLAVEIMDHTILLEKPDCRGKQELYERTNAKLGHSVT